jgi:hypothetical protein
MPHLARRIYLKMPCLPIAIFLSFANPPLDYLHLRETLRKFFKRMGYGKPEAEVWMSKVDPADTKTEERHQDNPPRPPQTACRTASKSARQCSRKSKR